MLAGGVGGGGGVIESSGEQIKGGFKYYVSTFWGGVRAKMLTLVMKGRGWGVSGKWRVVGVMVPCALSKT